MSARTAPVLIAAALLALLACGCGGGGGTAQSTTGSSQGSSAAGGPVAHNDSPAEAPASSHGTGRKAAPDQAGASRGAAPRPSSSGQAKKQAKAPVQKNPVQVAIERALKGSSSRSGGKSLKEMRENDPVAKIVAQARKEGVKVVQQGGGADPGLAKLLHSLGAQTP